MKLKSRKPAIYFQMNTEVRQLLKHFYDKN